MPRSRKPNSRTKSDWLIDFLSLLIFAPLALLFFGSASIPAQQRTQTLAICSLSGIAIFIFISAFIRGVIKRQHEHAVQQAMRFRSFTDVSPTDFERAVGNLFREQGYRVEHSGRTGDGGVDLEMQMNGLHYIVQCKRFTDKPVGEPDIRNFYGTLVNVRADHGFFVTTSRFTGPARTFAIHKPITLIDASELQKWLSEGEEGE